MRIFKKSWILKFLPHSILLLILFTPKAYTRFSEEKILGFQKQALKERTPVYFVDGNTVINNLSGNLLGMLQFAQTHTIYPNGNSAWELPRLVSERNTLLIFIALSTDLTSVTVTGRDENNDIIGIIRLYGPENQPPSDKPENHNGRDVKYAENAWTTMLPWTWIRPGLTLTLSDNNGNTGELNNIDIGAPNEVIIHNIRIGMLTDPLEALPHDLNFGTNPSLAIDYFQKIPVARLIVGNYSPVIFNKIVLPNGTTYVDQSLGAGDWYTGDMRGDIASYLVSLGINHANYGINSSTPAGATPYYSAMITAHRSVGRYSNGIIPHGYTGGGGIATLDNLTGNEFSHELGHNYWLGHYPGGPNYYNHSATSGWGWDSSQNTFIANFQWDVASQPQFLNFANLYKYNTDTMAGGVPSSPISKYVHHTGYTQRKIQSFLEGRRIFSSDSTTGYKLWNENSQSLVDAVGNPGRTLLGRGVEVVTLLGFYDPERILPSYLYPALYGSYGYVYNSDTVDTVADCYARVEFENNLFSNYKLATDRYLYNRMNQVHINVLKSQNPQRVKIYCPSHHITALRLEIHNGYFGNVEFPTSDIASGSIIQILRTSTFTPLLTIGNAVYSLPYGKATFKFNGQEWNRHNVGIEQYISHTLTNNVDITPSFIQDWFENNTDGNLNNNTPTSILLASLNIESPIQDPSSAIIVGRDRNNPTALDILCDNIKVKNSMLIKVDIECGDSSTKLNSYSTTTCQCNNVRIRTDNASCSSYNQSANEEYYVDDCYGFSESVSHDCAEDKIKCVNMDLTATYSNNRIRMTTSCVSSESDCN